MQQGRKVVVIGILLSLFVASDASAGSFCSWLLSWGRGGRTPAATTSTTPATRPAVDDIVPMIADGHWLAEIQSLTPEQRRAALQGYSPASSYSWAQKLWLPIAWTLAGIVGYQATTGLAGDVSRLPVAALLSGIALYAADMVTAFMHKFLDSFASETSPIWGQQALNFRRHHEYPHLGASQSYTQSAVEPARLTSPFLALVALASTTGHLSPEWGAGLFFFLMASMHGPTIHIATHRPDPGTVWRALQSSGLALSRRTHAAHHTPPFDTNYGVVNGWSNGLFRALDLWKRLDALYWKHFRRMPNNWIQDPRSIPPEVIAELTRELDSIPPELWGYSNTAYSRRVPAELRQVMSLVGARWRQQFVEGRRRLYLEMAERGERRRAEEEWLHEQRELPWAFGAAEPTPLFPASS